MSALFQNPSLVHVTAGDTEDTFTVTIKHRGVTNTHTAPAANPAGAIGTELMHLASNAGKPVGVVVFNAVTPQMIPLAYLVATDVEVRDAADEEVSSEQERTWDREWKAWSRTHGTPKRARRAATVPASRHEVEAAEGDTGLLESFQEEAPRDVESEIAAAEKIHGPLAPETVERMRVSTTEWDPDAVGRLTPAVRTADVTQWAKDTIEAANTVPAAQEGVFTEQMVRDAMEPAPTTRRQARELESLMDRGKHSPDAQDGWRGALNGLGLHLGPDAAETRRRELVKTIQPGWRGTKFATVVNEKGSAGKTPTSLMLAAALQEYGPGQVIVRDGNPTGNAHERAEYASPMGEDEQDTGYTDKDLARVYASWPAADGATPALDASTMAQFLHKHTTDKYALIAHHDSQGEFDQLDADDVELIQDALAAHARVIITDTGNSPEARRDVPVLRRTHQLIVPMLTYPDRENGARKTLSMLERRGAEDPHYLDLVSRAVVVIHTAENTREHQRQAQALARRWEDVVAKAIVVPHDPHMASHDLRFGDLRLGTRTAFLELAAAVAEGFRAA